MDLICKLLEDRGLGAQAWLVAWVGLLQAWTWARALGPWKWTLPEGSSCHGPAAGPLLTHLRPSVAEHCVLRASQQLRIPVIVSLLSQQKLGLTHSTRVSSECPRSSGSRRAVAGSYTVIRWGGGESFYFVYQTLEKWLPPYKLCIYSCSSERAVLLGSGCVYVFILKTYQQKSSFLCYRLPKIVKSFQFRSFFKCIVF